MNVELGSGGTKPARLYYLDWLRVILVFGVFVFHSALYLAMKYLNLTNKWLVKGNETLVPFYLLHQPMIIVIAYFVVQWDAGVTLKLLAIVIGSFLITLGLIELLIRPFQPVRMLFGMKPRKRKDVKA